MKVEFRKSFVKDIRGISDEKLLRKLKETIEAVENVSTLHDLPNCQKLKGEDGYFRLKIGVYRLGCALDGDALIFVRLLHRKDIYKFFP